MRKYITFTIGMIAGTVMVLSIPLVYAGDDNGIFGILKALLQQNSEELQQNKDLILLYKSEAKELRTTVANLQTGFAQLKAENAQHKQEVEEKLRRHAVRITYISGSQRDDTDVGILKSRTLSFTKVEEDSLLRITHSDILREIGTKCPYSHWNIFIDGILVLTTGLHNAKQDQHRRSTSIGYAKGISAGNHLLTIEVSGPNGNSTGWESDFLVEVQEIPRANFAGQKSK